MSITAWAVACRDRHTEADIFCSGSLTAHGRLVLPSPVLTAVHSNKIPGDFCFQLICLLWSFTPFLPPTPGSTVLWQSQHSVLSAVRAAPVNSPTGFALTIWAGSSMWYAGQVPAHKVQLALASTGPHEASKHAQLRILRLASMQDQNGQPKGFGFPPFTHSP